MRLGFIKSREKKISGMLLKQEEGKVSWMSKMKKVSCFVTFPVPWFDLDYYQQKD